jgi:divalent metal cation (Fe/Co/Zn/Cd) transporter
MPPEGVPGSLVGAEEPVRPHHAATVRAGATVSVISIVWTMVASSASVAIGAAHSSVVLVAFGCTGLLDAAGSTALVVHFRHTLRHGEFSDRHEAVALNIVTVGLLVVALATAAESVHRLLDAPQSDHAVVGTAVAAASAVVLPVLAVVKRRLGRRIPSHALVADGWLSLTGGLLACVTVVGTVMADRGLESADPAAALVISVAAAVIAVWLRREARTSD